MDEINENTLWQDAINKVMSKANVSWKTLDGKTLDGITPNEAQKGKIGELIGYQEIRNHIVFLCQDGFFEESEILCRWPYHKCSRWHYLLKCCFKG